jgi:hypothetical protein
LRGRATLATVGQMSRSARAKLVYSAAAALLAGALAGGCGSSPPTDKNFGTDLGADFRAPITDAEASVDGTGTGTGGTTASGGTTGTGGTTSTGAAGSGGSTGTGGAAGNAGTAGAGS